MADQVIYSVAMPLNRGGMGTFAWHACLGLMRAGMLRRVLSSDVRAAKELSPFAVGLPGPFRHAAAALNRFGWHYWKDSFFDRWASAWMEPGTDYYGWLHQSLACIGKCHQGGGRTWLDRGSVEPRLQQRWLMEEYSKFGLRTDPISPLTLQRMMKEADQTDMIVAPSILVAESYLAAGYDEHKLWVNPLGIQTPPPSATQPRRSDEKTRFAFVGQLSIQKGVPGLLQTWQRLAAKNAELVLAGIVPRAEESVIHPLLRETPATVWNGHCCDVPELLRNCDALVLPSAQDGFGFVVLEAFAAGLPVVVSDRVGAKDCIAEGKDGFIFPYNQPGALEERLRWLLDDPSRARSMSAAARAKAECYSWESYGERLAARMKTDSASRVSGGSCVRCRN